MLSDSEWLSQKLALGRTGQVTAQPLCSSENTEGSLAGSSRHSEFGLLPPPPGQGVTHVSSGPGGGQRGLPFPRSRPGERGWACIIQALPTPQPRWSHLCSGPGCWHWEETQILDALGHPSCVSGWAGLLITWSLNNRPSRGTTTRTRIARRALEGGPFNGHHQFHCNFQLMSLPGGQGLSLLLSLSHSVLTYTHAHRPLHTPRCLDIQLQHDGKKSQCNIG